MQIIQNQTPPVSRQVPHVSQLWTAGHEEDWGLVCSVPSAQGLLSFTDFLLLEILPLCYQIVKNFQKNLKMYVYGVWARVCVKWTSQKKIYIYISVQSRRRKEGWGKEKRKSVSDFSHSSCREVIFKEPEETIWIIIFKLHSRLLSPVRETSPHRCY